MEVVPTNREPKSKLYVAPKKGQNHWEGFSLPKMCPPMQSPLKLLPIYTQIFDQPYSRGTAHSAEKSKTTYPIHRSYKEARNLIGQGSPDIFSSLASISLEFLSHVFEGAKPDLVDDGSSSLVFLKLSDNLCCWRDKEHQSGRILPPKGNGLERCSKEVLDILGASAWPDALTTCGALFGAGFYNFLTGAVDTRTMLSNYIMDMSFYYEHNYHRIFPEFENLIEEALSDSHALETLGGVDRRRVVKIGREYIRAKASLEEAYQKHLSMRSAKMNRQMCQIVSLCESSVLGVAMQAIAYGFDPAGVFSDLVFSCPSTDVIDVGRDLLNSKVMNSFLNTADITDSKCVTEEALRRVYDAFAHVGARISTERWMEPTAPICSILYIWHIVDSRHRFLRLVVLGYVKARRGSSDQREADFDEAFDENHHTTRFSRPLKSPCNGDTTYNIVKQLLGYDKAPGILQELWQYLVTEPLAYAERGVIDENYERQLEESLRVALVTAYSQGLVLEMSWLIAHASHHAWQVNYLYEAAMFGSFLDSGALVGKTDRAQGPL